MYLVAAPELCYIRTAEFCMLAGKIMTIGKEIYNDLTEKLAFSSETW